MKPRIVPSLIACGLVSIAAGKSMAADLDHEYAKLQGEWVSQSFEAARIPKDSRKLTLLFQNKKVTISIDGKTSKVDCELNIEQDPKWMDLVTREGPATISTNCGIYKLEGSTLTICHGSVLRPSKFEIRPGDSYGDSLIVLKRK